MSWGPVGGLAVGESTLATGAGGVSATVPAPYASATSLRVTQVGAEVWVLPVPSLLVTQVGAEVWIDMASPYAPPPVVQSRQPNICIIT